MLLKNRLAGIAIEELGYGMAFLGLEGCFWRSGWMGMGFQKSASCTYRL